MRRRGDINLWFLTELLGAILIVTLAVYISSELANKIAYECTQFFGGMGYMEETDISRFYRDLRLLSIGGGTSEIMREIIAKSQGF